MIAGDFDQGQNRDGLQHGLTATTSEISCTNCGNRYRVAVAIHEDLHFHCVACNSYFSIQPAVAHQQERAAPPLPTITTEEKKVNTISITPKQEQSAAPLSLSPPPTPPSVRLWPWLIALLLMITVIGGWVNMQVWVHTPLLQTVHAWWAPQRSIGWEITQARPQWINRKEAAPLLAIGLQLHNEIMFDRPPPPLLIITHTRGNSLPAEPQMVMLHQQPSLAQLEQPNWQPPREDHTPIHAGGERNYTIVLDHPPHLLESVELTLN